MANPLKMIYLNDFLGMYDWSMAGKFSLNKGVSEHVLLPGWISHTGTFELCRGDSMFVSDVWNDCEELRIRETLQICGEHERHDGKHSRAVYEEVLEGEKLSSSHFLCVCRLLAALL